MEAFILTREQEHKVYVALLEKMLNDIDIKYGICKYLNTLLDYDCTMPVYWKYFGGPSKMELLLPVLYSMKPATHLIDIHDYWFPLTQDGFNTRIELVKKAIELTK